MATSAREIRNLLGVRKAVGEGYPLMIDPASQLRTWADALAVGRACDEARYFWYEDPYRDTGGAVEGHKRLRERLATPLLVGEHVRGVEAKAQFILAGGGDLLHVDPEYDLGITGAMKIATFMQALGLDVQYHACGPAHRAVMAATPNTHFYEMALVGPDMPNVVPPVYGPGLFRHRRRRSAATAAFRCRTARASASPMTGTSSRRTRSRVRCSAGSGSAVAMRGRRSPLALLAIALVIGSGAWAAEPNSALVRSRAALAARYMRAAQSFDGRFGYEFDFVAGRFLERDSIVRQAGAGSALAEYLDWSGDETLNRPVERAIAYYAAKSVPFHGGRVVSSDGNAAGGNTGATALALLTELFYRDATGSDRFADSRRAWLTALGALQRPNGGFRRAPGSRGRFSPTTMAKPGLRSPMSCGSFPATRPPHQSSLRPTPI